MRTPGHHSNMYVFPKLQQKSLKHTSCLECLACSNFPFVGTTWPKSVPSSWQCLCAQSKVHADVACQGWIGRLAWSVESPYLNLTEPFCDEMAQPTALKASSPWPPHCLTSPMLSLLNSRNPHRDSPKSTGKPSQKNASYYYSKGCSTSTNGCEWSGICPRTFGHIVYAAWSKSQYILNDKLWTAHWPLQSSHKSHKHKANIYNWDAIQICFIRHAGDFFFLLSLSKPQQRCNDCHMPIFYKENYLW